MSTFWGKDQYFDLTAKVEAVYSRNIHDLHKGKLTRAYFYRERLKGRIKQADYMRLMGLYNSLRNLRSKHA